MKKIFLICHFKVIWEHTITFEKIATSQGGDYTTCSLLLYTYFNKQYKIVAIDLSEEQALDDPKAIQQNNFTGNLDGAEGATMFFITEGAQETILDFSQGTLKVL